METALAVALVGLVIFLAHLFVTLFERTRVPDVLYLILIGVVLGPLIHAITPEDFGKLGHVFTTIALAIILFEGGLELDIHTLRTSLRGTLILTLVSYLLALLIITPVVLALTHLTWGRALFVGAVLAGPAPAVVIPLVRHLKIEDHSRTGLTVESPLGEALCIVVALAILESLRLGTVDIGRLIGTLLASFLFALIIGAVGGYVWSLLLHKMRQLRNAVFTTPAFVFVLFGISEFLGFSGPVAALTFGITLGNTAVLSVPKIKRWVNLTLLQHNEVEKLFFGEIVFLLKTFFFVYMGISIRFADVWTMGTAVSLTLVLLISRSVAVRLSSNPRLLPRTDAMLMSVMIPKGTAAAVLASIPLQLKLEGAVLMQNIIYAVVVLSIVATSVLVYLVERERLVSLSRFLFAGYNQPPSTTPKIS